MIGAVRRLAREVVLASRFTGDLRSFARFATDAVAHRLLRVVRLPTYGRERTIRLRGGLEVTYRLDRGDVYTVREIWGDRAYELPPGLRPAVVVDLGAHIGLAALWLADRYRPRVLVCVEPSPANAALARRNLERNGVEATVVEAAVGDRDGEASFETSAESNKGTLGSGSGLRVPLVSMRTLLGRLPEGEEVDLLKIDVEGAERLVLGGDRSWLRRVHAIVGELHGEPAEQEAVVRVLTGAGFRELPRRPGDHETRCFVRETGEAAGRGPAHEPASPASESAS